MTKRTRQHVRPPEDWQPPSGYCECGCGGKTPIAKQTSRKRDQYKNYPLRYLRGHNMLGKKREQANSWQGGKKVNRLGYSLVFLPEHHLADGAGYVYEHRLIWEQNNGRELRPGEHVHHIDGNPRNNSPDNLVALSRTAHYKTHGDSITTSRRKSEGQKRRWSRPEEHRKQSEAIRKAWADGRRS